MEPGPYEDIADVYDHWCAEVVEDVDFYRRVCRGATGPVIELGAGTGRISVPLAVDGLDVLALDLSPSMLERLAARAEAAGVGSQITTLAADMTALPGLPATDRVIAPFRVLMHLRDDEARVDLLTRIADVLEPGGLLAFDVLEPTKEDVRATQDRWIERDSGVRERAHWDREARELDLEVRYRGRSTLMRLGWVAGARWPQLLLEAGLELMSVNGGFDGEPWSGQAGDTAWVAVKPE